MQAVTFDSVVYNSVPKVTKQKSPEVEAIALYDKVCSDDRERGESFFIRCGQLGVGLTGFHNHGSVQKDEVVLEKFAVHPATNEAALITEPVKKELLGSTVYSASTWIIKGGQLYQFELSEDSALSNLTPEISDAILELAEYIKKFGYTSSLAPMIITRNDLAIDSGKDVYFEETFERKGDGAFRNVLTVQSRYSDALKESVVTRVAFDINNCGKPKPYGFCLSTTRHGGNNNKK